MFTRNHQWNRLSLGLSLLGVLALFYNILPQSCFCFCFSDFLFLHYSVLVNSLFLWIYLFLDYVFSCQIIVHSSFLWYYIFLWSVINISSFISNFISVFYLNLFWWLMNFINLISKYLLIFWKFSAIIYLHKLSGLHPLLLFSFCNSQ